MLNYKHTVILICFNQENYIEQALNSILFKNPLPYELLIYDDCSTDKTLKILKEYQKKFPDIITINSNNINIGLYKNIQKASKIYNGEVVHFVAGDDMIGENLILEIDKSILEAKINPIDFEFICMPKIKLIDLDNNSRFIKTKLLNSKKLDYLMATRRIFWQFKGLSSKMMKKWGDYSIGNSSVGIYSDFVHSVIFFSNKPMIIDIQYSFDIHRIGSGVTSKNYNEIFLSYFRACNFLLKNNNEYNYNLSEDCKKFLNYEIKRSNYIKNKNLQNAFYFLLQSMFILLNDVTTFKIIATNIYLSIKHKQI